MERWQSLIGVKRSFIAVNIPYDCRCLLEFCEQAHAVWQDLGYASPDDMIREGYELDPDEVRMACDWLKRRKPDWAVPFEEAVVLGKQEYGKGKPGPGRGNKTADNISRFRHGTEASYTLARLRRDNPELAERVEAGELSANAAAIEAGFRKRTITIQVEAESAAKIIRKHFSKHDIERLRKLLDD